MSEQLSFYKLFTEKGYTIEIPIIQRDYAQGRKSASEVRLSFLEALHSYLDEGLPFRDLDFIYGDIVGSDFVPLDGQQRLTTLFLLHWYLALKENFLVNFKNILFDNGVSRFTYKTRESSSDFCNALLKQNTLSLEHLLHPDENQNNELSKTIKDSPWYFLSWDFDPTIQSMLCMLDAINRRFKNSKGFYNKLVDTKNPVITFQFLPLQDYGLTDDLYIKMNSRGKPLTKFENFKAKFEQHLNKFRNELQYPPNIREYFSNNIDTKWAALFWTFRNKNKNIFDDQIMNFIATIAINHYALNRKPKTVKKLKKLINKQNNISLRFYLNRNKKFIATLIDCFDLLSADNSYKQYLSSCHYYNEINAFENIINNNFSDALFPERIKFFAYYSFLVEWKGDITGLSDWMRVIVNLTENTIPYNNEIEFANSIRSISGLIPKSNMILEFLRSDKKFTGFNPAQIKEERVKAHLIGKSKWDYEILEAEKHPYFKGQLSFAIAFSGIEAYFDKHGNCNWDNATDKKYLDLFKHYIQMLFSLFDENGLRSEAKEKHRFHRAVLSKGDYLLYAKANFSFLTDKGRDISWKRLLFGDDSRKKNREFVKQVMDDTRFNVKELSSFDNFIAIPTGDIPEWQKRFIVQPELFDYLGTNKYIRFNNEDEDDVYLLKGIKTSGQHSELFTYSLYLKLKNELLCKPFNACEYYFVSGESIKPYFYLNHWKFEENFFTISVNYAGEGHFKLIFSDINYNGINGTIKKILQSNQFIENGVSFELTIEEKKVKDIIEKVCKKFMELI